MVKIKLPVDSRQAKMGATIRRRRECENVSTVSRPSSARREDPLVVVKKGERTHTRAISPG